MEHPRSGFNGAVRVIGAVVILLIGSIHRAASELPTATCTAGTDGTSADAPCMRQAYLGSTVKIDCSGGYNTFAPTKVFTQNGLNACEERLPAAPAPCSNETLLSAKGLTSVKVDNKVFYVPWPRNVEFKGPVTLYGRCAKSNNDALYFGIEYIPRPKFPTNGVFISCPALVTADNQFCLLDSRLGDFAVFDCPDGSPAVIVPAQTGGNATICDGDLSGSAAATCTGGASTIDLSTDGVVATQLKNGDDEIEVLGFQNPRAGTKQGREGYLNCKGTSVTAHYKYKFTFANSLYKMPSQYTICDPVTGSDQTNPCSASLKPGESYLVNCSGLTKTAPDTLMQPDGSFCTQMPSTNESDLCADNKAAWTDYGISVFPNAGNLVITHTRDNLTSAQTAYGKCFEGANGNYFKIVFETTSSSVTPGNGAFTTTQSRGLAIFFGILGFICLSTEAFLKI